MNSRAVPGDHAAFIFARNQTAAPSPRTTDPRAATEFAGAGAVEPPNAADHRLARAATSPA